MGFGKEQCSERVVRVESSVTHADRATRDSTSAVLTKSVGSCYRFVLKLSDSHVISSVDEEAPLDRMKCFELEEI
jgi:hypothetical protein